MNLTLYEQRLQRTQKEALRQLQELQAKRIAARQAAAFDQAEAEAVAIRNPNKIKSQPVEPAPDPSPNQFVFSTAEIEREADRENRREDAPNVRTQREPAPSAERLNEAQAA